MQDRRRRPYFSTLPAGLLLVGIAQIASAQAIGPPSDQGRGLAGTSPAAAARFLAQASFGPNQQLIAEVASNGTGAWLAEQLKLPPSYHQPLVEQHIEEVTAPILELLGIPDLEALDRPGSLDGLDPETVQFLARNILSLVGPARRFAWWQTAMVAPDQLRQRVAFALSEIFVVSDNVAELGRQPAGLASYYDVLVRHALGNYRDLLREVTYHPAMGIYLSHLNNQRSDPEIGRFADENYAREVMQLFSIGLWKLHPDGTPVLGPNGQAVATYTNDQITEMAKIFTGLGPGGPRGRFGRRADLVYPMRMYEEFHEPGEKVLLDGFVVAAGQTGLQDVEDAITMLFEHQNTGPFIGRRLIQRLVKSNPSTDYLARVSAVFADNGAGVRGDLAAVVRAILLDREARQSEGESSGHLQEPWLRYVGLLRAFGAKSNSGTYLNVGEVAGQALSQHPLSAPSVFNFFSPDFRPNGPVAAAGLAAPEFQLTNTSTVVSLANLLNEIAFGAQAIQLPLRGLICLEALQSCYEAAQCRDDQCLRDVLEPVLQPAIQAVLEDFGVTLDVSDEIAIAGDAQALVDRLDLLLAHGSLSAESRQDLVSILDGVSSPEARARLGIYLVALSPDAAVTN